MSDFKDTANDHLNCGTSFNKPCPRNSKRNWLCGTDNLKTYKSYKGDDEEVVPVSDYGVVDFSKKKASFRMAKLTCRTCRSAMCPKTKKA